MPDQLVYLLDLGWRFAFQGSTFLLAFVICEAVRRCTTKKPRKHDANKLE